MPDFLLWLGFCSLLMLFAAGLLALLCQHWRNRRALSVAIALGLIGGFGVLGFFTSLLLPSEAIALLQQWASRNGLALNVAAIAFCIGLAGWREQQDRRRGDRPASPAPSSRPSRAIFTWLNPRALPASPPLSIALQRRLNQLTHDPATSARLISAQLAENPGRSPNWAAERAIWQLERDRCRG